MGKIKEKLKKDLLSVKVGAGWEAQACCVGALFWLTRAEQLKWFLAFYLCVSLSRQCLGNPEYPVALGVVTVSPSL